VIRIVFINSEGKFNDNSYLLDGMLMNLQKFLSVYIIESKGERLMIEVGEAIIARKLVKKLKDFGLYPIHKLLVTHSHWDHAQGISKFIQLIKDSSIEVLASESGAYNLKHPEKTNEYYNYTTYPVEDVTPLKEGDIIELNGLELEVVNFFGHTMDSIAILDRQNQNIIVGDAIIDRLDEDAFFTPPMPQDFNEQELLKTFEKLRSMRDELNSISIAHFGVWKDDHFNQVLDEMEPLYHETKQSIIQWYTENLSLEQISEKYCEKFMPNSKTWNAKLMRILVEWMIDCLKMVGFIK